MTRPLPASARVVIIGGGILGCAAAWHLTRLGVTDVLLLERNSIGSAATSRAAALMTRARTKTCLIPLVAQTYDDVAALQIDLKVCLDLNVSGSLHLAASEQAEAEQAKLAEVASAHAIPCDGLSLRDAARKLPWLRTDDLRAALFFPTDATIDPYRLAAAYADAARGHGARIVQGVAVDRLVRLDGAICGVETDQGAVAAETVIDAAGAWANLLLRETGVGLPMAPVRSHYWITADDPLFPRDQPFTVLPDAAGFTRAELGGLLFGLREKASVSADPLTLPTVIDGFSFADDPNGWETLEERAEGLHRILPALDRVALRHYVVGLSTYTPDGLFVVGEVPGLTGLLAATGCCGGGIAAAGGIGRLAAHIAAGQTPPWDPQPFAPGRFGAVDPFSTAFRDRCAAARAAKTSG